MANIYIGKRSDRYRPLADGVQIPAQKQKSKKKEVLTSDQLPQSLILGSEETPAYDKDKLFYDSPEQRKTMSQLLHEPLRRAPRKYKSKNVRDFGLR